MPLSVSAPQDTATDSPPGPDTCSATVVELNTGERGNLHLRDCCITENGADSYNYAVKNTGAILSGSTIKKSDAILNDSSTSKTEADLCDLIIPKIATDLSDSSIPKAAAILPNEPEFNKNELTGDENNLTDNRNSNSSKLVNDINNKSSDLLRRIKGKTVDRNSSFRHFKKAAGNSCDLDTRSSIYNSNYRERSVFGVPVATVPKWLEATVISALVFIFVVSTAAFIVWAVLPYVHHQYTNKNTDSTDKSPGNGDDKDSDGRNFKFETEEDLFIRQIVVIVVGCFLLVLFTVTCVLVALYCRRKPARGIDDGLLEDLEVRDNIVKLTKLLDERGEYRIDLSSGELNTAVELDENDYIASVRRAAESEAHKTADDQRPQSIQTSEPDEPDVIQSVPIRNNSENHLRSLDDDNRRSSVRTSSYKRAIETNSFYDFQNRPKSVLFDVDKYLNENKDKRTSSIGNFFLRKVTSFRNSLSPTLSNASKSSNLANSDTISSGKPAEPVTSSQSSPSSPSSVSSPSDSAVTPRSECVVAESAVSSDTAAHRPTNSSSQSASCGSAVPVAEASNSSSSLVFSQTPSVPSYGTLGRSRILSSVDDDGYHFDNLGFGANSDADSDSPFDNTFEKFSFDATTTERSQNQSGAEKSNGEIDDETLEDSVILAAVDRLEKDLQKSSQRFSANDEENLTCGEDVQLRSASDPEKSIFHQDSFQGLPNQGSFDKYLSLVRLDSTTSLLSPVSEEPPCSLDNLPPRVENDTLRESPSVRPSGAEDCATRSSINNKEDKRKGMLFSSIIRK